MSLQPIYAPVIVGYRRIETFGYRIFKTALEAKLTLREISDATNINILHLSAIECDQEKPTEREIKALAEFLKLDIDELRALPMCGNSVL